ncbi:hypothetical protein F2Q70_00001967 [Brassica cretica]|uniref:Uncharacterized protein n=1 Tax=Brassica cretica TaxID=69181 RepID=A0A8S9ISX3_BRACR|nr:hypothetical protein F2Q70_00001967 [Brassica cretica]
MVNRLNQKQINKRVLASLSLPLFAIKVKNQRTTQANLFTRCTLIYSPERERHPSTASLSEIKVTNNGESLEPKTDQQESSSELITSSVKPESHRRDDPT